MKLGFATRFIDNSVTFSVLEKFKIFSNISWEKGSIFNLFKIFLKYWKFFLLTSYGSFYTNLFNVVDVFLLIKIEHLNVHERYIFSALAYQTILFLYGIRRIPRLVAKYKKDLFE